MSRSKAMGFSLLLASILLSTIAQFLLKAAMNDIGLLPSLADLNLWPFITVHQIPLLQIGLGLGLYASGTVSWLLCLTRLELSFAYPVSTLQYLLVFLAAWLLLGEEIYPLRWVGMVVIVLGVVVMSSEKTADA
jgi:drug/metabolite transporter (DMT)-like permease